MVVDQIVATSRSKLTKSQRASDFCARLVRSWSFVIGQLVFIAVWILLNGLHITHFDKFPFDTLKLILVVESSFMGSMILMSQNRRSNIDRKLSYQDYAINYGAKKEIDQILPLIKDDHRKLAELLDALKKDNQPNE
jgi:uncharacterized membrane protein